MKNRLTNLCLMLLCVACMWSCNSAKTNVLKPHDPSQPVKLATFYPDSGRYLEKIILTGENFGNDPSKVSVYFNQRQAPVVGSTGTMMYVLAPRLPGDECVISVVVGNDSIVYPNIFKYRPSVTVTTIAGNGKDDYIKEGPLSESVLHARFICADKDGNIFGLSRAGSPEEFAIFRINEEDDELSVIAKGIVANVPGVDPVTGVVTFATEESTGSYVSLDPLEFWGPRRRNFTWITTPPPQPWKHCMVVNPEDGCIYTKFWHGQVAKFDPKTREAEVICTLPMQGCSFGLTFIPAHPNILYLSMDEACGEYSNSICTLDVTDPENSFKRVSSNITSGGHRDGELSMAQFHNPYQIFSDADSNIYVADNYNHCIRMIRPDGIVETVVGIPKVLGWKDGNKDEALFHNPVGVAVGPDGSVYVADWSNARVRKLSIN